MNHLMYPADQQTQTLPDRPAGEAATEPEMLHAECSLPPSPNSNQRASGKSVRANLASYQCLGGQGFCTDPEHIWRPSATKVTEEL